MYSAGTLTFSDLNERSRLLDHSEMQTDAFDGDDDPVTKVTKYQTHIIMVTDKLAENPDSTKMIGQVDNVAQATANLMKSMANSEDDLNLKVDSNLSISNYQQYSIYESFFLESFPSCC